MTVVRKADLDTVLDTPFAKRIVIPGEFRTEPGIPNRGDWQGQSDGDNCECIAKFHEIHRVCALAAGPAHSNDYELK